MDSSVLPPELERELFETAAMMYPEEIPTLLRVARRILTWIELLLYRVAYLQNANPGVVRALLKPTKPPEFFHKAVRHLALESGHFSREDARRVLRLCKGVINLACDQSFTDPELLPILAEMRVQRLSLSLTLLVGEPCLKHPLFASITLLDLFDIGGETVAKICAQIPTLPALTHLSVDFETPRTVLMRLLEESSRLGLLLILWPSFHANLYRAAQIPHVYDVRFVIGQYHNYWASWEACAKGLPNLWSLGDDFVARKRRGEIEATCYWLN
ncbi:hypothetical protein B0H13DRAFT_2262881 [Mycena leptocephala]|nr:hypothetical protein B0H13DRAFT_2262881 [Mycena leptocephala]